MTYTKEIIDGLIPKSIDDIEVPIFLDVHIKYLQDMISMYDSDLSNIDPLAFDAKPEFSMLQIHMVSLDSMRQILYSVINAAESKNAAETAIRENNLDEQTNPTTSLGVDLGVVNQSII